MFAHHLHDEPQMIWAGDAEGDRLRRRAAFREPPGHFAEDRRERFGLENMLLRGAPSVMTCGFLALRGGS